MLEKTLSYYNCMFMTAPNFSAVRALIFDLDGTLIDSKLDLIRSVNAMLQEMGREQLHEDTISRYIGHGAPQLVGRALGNGATEADRQQRRYSRRRRKLRLRHARPRRPPRGHLSRPPHRPSPAASRSEFMMMSQSAMARRIGPASAASMVRQAVSPPYLFMQVRQFRFLSARTLLG